MAPPVDLQFNIGLNTHIRDRMLLNLRDAFEASDDPREVVLVLTEGLGLLESTGRRTAPHSSCGRQMTRYIEGFCRALFYTRALGSAQLRLSR